MQYTFDYILSPPPASPRSYFSTLLKRVQRKAHTQTDTQKPKVETWSPICVVNYSWAWGLLWRVTERLSVTLLMRTDFADASLVRVWTLCSLLVPWAGNLSWICAGLVHVVTVSEFIRASVVSGRHGFPRILHHIWLWRMFIPFPP